MEGFVLAKPEQPYSALHAFGAESRQWNACMSAAE